MNVLVVGASGYVGSHLVPRLQAAGHVVRAAGRRLEVLEGRGWTDVELVAADALLPETLEPALEGIDVAVYLVHSMGSGSDFAEKDRIAAANFRDAAARARVKRIVYLGGIQPDDAASAHLESRRETGDVLRDGPVPVTEIRAGIVVGAGSAAFEVIRDLVNHLPVMITPRWVRSRSQPIALDDLLEYLVRCLDVDATAGGIYDVAGPETLSYAQLIRQFGEVTGKRHLLIPVPVLTPRLSSYWLDLVTSVPAAVARPLIDGLKHDLLADDRPIRELIPIPLRSWRDAVAQALRHEREEPLTARWVEGALAFRGYNPEVSFYSKGVTVRLPAAAPADVLWRVVSSIGGRRGYYYANILWRLRGFMDRLVGGVGMRRGRRHPSDVRIGDAIDFWRVVGVEQGRRLTLVAEMKVPGAAVLEIEVIPDGEDRSILVFSPRFHPSGMPGLLYWYALLLPHNAIFNKMPAAIVSRAERLAQHRARAAASTPA